MATSNCWQVSLNAEMGGQDVVNVFFYRGNALTDPDAADIAQSFYEQILPDIKAICTEDVEFVSIGVRDLMSTDTPYTLAVGESGTFAGTDTLPPHDACTFKLNVATNVTRPGSKRFAGLNEGVQTDGVIADAGYTSALNDLALTLAFNLFDHATGLIPWAAAVIVKRLLIGSEPEDGYRLPETVGELVTNAIVSAVPSLLVSSQISRKREAG